MYIINHPADFVTLMLPLHPDEQFGLYHLSSWPGGIHRG